MKKLLSIILISVMCVSLVSCSKKEEIPEGLSKPSTKIDASEVYKDVVAGEWYDDAVDWAVNDEIAIAAKPDSFGTNSSVSKQEIILYLWRAAGAPGAVSSAKANTDQDINTAIDWAIKEGIVVSKYDCMPNTTASRLDAIDFMWNHADNPIAADVKEFDDAKGIDSVNWARYKMITFGTGNNKFSPDMDCSKAMILTFLFRAK